MVSWKEAAEINDLVWREALVIPCSSGVAVEEAASRATTGALPSLINNEFGERVIDNR